MRLHSPGQPGNGSAAACLPVRGQPARLRQRRPRERPRPLPFHTQLNLETDDIGPACDTAGNSCAGCPGTLTPAGANGHYHAAYAAQTICIGAANLDCSFSADNDGDGVVNATDTYLEAPNPPQVFAGTFGNGTLTAPANAGATTIVVSGRFTTGSPIVIQSPPETLRYITDQVGNTLTITPPLTHAHDAGDPVAQVSFAQTPRDLQQDGFSDTADIATVTAGFGAVGGDPCRDGVDDDAKPGYAARKDLDHSGAIDTADTAAHEPVRQALRPAALTDTPTQTLSAWR
jgi:hypothetical protein